MQGIRELRAESDLTDALGRELAILYKHSPWCGLSASARLEMVFFSEGNPSIPIFEVDVIHQRPLSRHIAETLDIEHESPQVIVLREGRPVAWASHRGVTAHAIEAELRKLSAS